MTGGQLISLILAIVGAALCLIALWPGADARLGFIGAGLIGLSVVFLDLDVSGELH